MLDRAGDHRRRDAERLLVDGAEGDRPRAVDHQHPDELAERLGGDDQPAVGTRPDPAIGTSRPGRTPPLSSNWRRIEREYFAICRRLPTAIGSQRWAAIPISPSPTTTSAPMLSAPKPAAGDRVQPVALLVEQQQLRVLVTERPVEHLQRGVDEDVEVAGTPDRRRQLGESDSSGGASRSGRHLRPRRRHRVRRDAGDIDDPEDVGGAQPEHVLHAREGGDRVDVGPQLLEQVTAPLGALVDEREPELVVGERLDEQQAGPRVDRRGSAPSST